MKSRELFLVAAEESANQYAFKLIESFRTDAKLQDVKFSGIGFEGLKESNFNIVFNAERLSVMGAFEVLQKWKTLKEAFSLSIDYIVKNQPSAVLLIDFGGFNLKLAAEIKKKSPNTKVLYFISPKLWAWGAKRALKVKASVDEMYVIHPFEVDFYKKWGVEAKFVGHPLLQELKEDFSDPKWVAEQKLKEGFKKEQRILGVMLGSRPSELSKHARPFCEAISLLKKKHAGLGVAFIIPPSNKRESYDETLKDVEFEYKIFQSKAPMEKIALCDVCLVASGTATLQVGMLGIPMAIGYRMNPITMFLAKIFVKGIKFAGLVNIIKGREISKEFLQNDLEPEAISVYLDKLLSDDKFYKETQADLLSLKKDLGVEHTYERLKNELVRFI